MREFIECYDRVFINIDTTEEKAVANFDKTLPILWLKDKKYVDFIDYINNRCKGYIEAVRALITSDGKVCCKLNSNITTNTIVLLNCINLNDFVIYADDSNIFIDFKNNLIVVQDNK